MIILEEELYFVDSEDLQHLKDSIKRKTYNENDISMHFVNTYSTSESTITGFVDEIAKIERWPYAGTNMAMMGFKSVNSEGGREDVNLTALNSIITSADSTRKITFLYTNNSQILSSRRYIISSFFPYLNVLIAPKVSSLPHDFTGLSISYLQLDYCTTIA